MYLNWVGEWISIYIHIRFCPAEWGYCLALGLKSGGYWPGNSKKGLTNHQSTVFLLDPDTGRLQALVGGNYLTAVRTAAAQLAEEQGKALSIKL